MSFYNLIPSCPICNHTKSSKVSENLINPYDIKDDDFKFTYKPTDISFSQIESKKYNSDSFEIEFKNHNENIDIFKLDELYKQHKDIVVDLLMKKAYYPKSYIEELENKGGHPGGGRAGNAVHRLSAPKGLCLRKRRWVHPFLWRAIFHAPVLQQHNTWRFGGACRNHYRVRPCLLC